MNKKLFLFLGILAQATPAGSQPEARSLLGVFEQKKEETSSTQEKKSSGPTLPTPPPVDTKALAFKPEVTAQPEQNNTPQQKTQPQPPVVTTEQKKPTLPEETAAQKAKRAEQSKEEQKKDQLIRFYFEDASLENLVRYIEELFAIKFFVDDDINPPPPGAGLLKGNKISFKSNKPLSRADAWALFLKFLDMAGLAVIESQITGFYRITTVTNANKEVLPTFFNTSVDALPDNNLKVRYVFFVKNTPLATIATVVSQLASSTALVDTFPDLNAIIVTDKAINIRSLMRIVQELDKEMPEAMSVLRLKKADATDVYNLYTDLTKTESPQGASRFMGQKAQPDSLYFPANVRLIVEQRTNSLILLGPTKSLEKIEEFITKNIDVDLDMPYSPLYIYEVQYLNAQNLATLLTNVVSFGSGTSAGTFGGVRNGNQYFGPMTINAEPSGNRIIIKAEERDYKKLMPIIQQLDVLQPEVAIEVLIINVSSTDNKALGSQIRNKNPNIPFQNVNMQTSGFPAAGGNASGPVINATTGSLLGNLISLATGGTTGDGSTYLTIGSPVNQAGTAGGVWAIFKALSSFTDTNIIANPFLLSTNNYAASISVGTTRQVQTGSVISSQGPTGSFGSIPANLTVNILPQISLDSSVQMAITVNLTDFTDATNQASGNTFTKSVTTSVAVKNREIVVLGGITQNQVTDIETKLPILGDIPLVGWLFKNKQKTTIKTNILIFISPRILTLKDEQSVDFYTVNKAQESKDLSQEMDFPADKRDPISRMFFGTSKESTAIERFLDNDPSIAHTQQIINKAEAELKEERKQKRKEFLAKRKKIRKSENGSGEHKESRRGRFGDSAKAKNADKPQTINASDPSSSTTEAAPDIAEPTGRRGRFKKNSEERS